MSPTLNVKGKESAAARILGSGTSGACLRFTSIPQTYVQLGVAELLVFHPVDTIAKRLMSNKSKASNLANVR